jgi:N-acyl-L-homoserine lactone synthetase
MNTQGVQIRIVKSREELVECFRLRHEVFVKEFGVVAPKNPNSGLDVDKLDRQSIHLIVEEDGRMVGAMRLIPAGKRPNFRGLYEIDFDLDSDRVLEVSRVAILRERRGDAKLFCKLMHFIFLYAKTNGYKYFCGTFRPSLFRKLQEHLKIDFIFTSAPFPYGIDHKWKMVAFISPVSDENTLKFARGAE